MPYQDRHVELPEESDGELLNRCHQLAGACCDVANENVAADEKLVMFRFALQNSGIGELQHVKLTISEGQLTLRGTVSCFYLKQLAQECVRPFAIGLRINNQLDVT